jgi:hypothetical protein
MKNKPRSDSHRAATLAWLREEPANCAALGLIADAGLPLVKGRDGDL